ncbi:CATRA conflict system CASPASE/TPR repeat-associated protein [Streptomyces sp. YS-3]|uniref:CATRA conflict system CASPASE/TPR repeat-associated protein n=1 Tax=Streptomyces sp. YS-3 TaxID=3381352 RepID=UPI0038623768
MRTFIKPALVITCFAPRTAENSDSPHPYLGALWTACRALGMTSPVRGLPEPEPVLPQLPDHVQHFTMLAAARRDSEDGIHSAFAFTEHDVTGLVALLAPNDRRADLRQWSDLLGQWTTALAAAGPVPSSEGILHEFRVFEALRRTGTGGGSRALCDHIRRYAPSDGGGSWWQGFDETDEGFQVWRAGDYDSPQTVSDLYVLAPARLEDALDAWAWTLPAQYGLRPLTRYLMNVAKVSYERRLYASSEPLQPRIDQSDREAEALLRTLEPAALGEPVPLERVHAAADLLDRTQFGPHGLLWTITHLRQLTRTVSIAIDNMRLNTPAVRRRGTGYTWPDSEMAAAEALIRQVQSDQVYLEATRERADAARSVASALTERALNEQRNRLTLVQTSLLGAVITALTVVQAFDYRLPLSRTLQSPLILLLAALALALPLTMLRSVGGAAVPTAYRWLDFCAGGLLGTAVGWTAVEAWGVRGGHGAVPLVVTLPCAGAAGLLACGAYYWLAGRRSRPR